MTTIKEMDAAAEAIGAGTNAGIKAKTTKATKEPLNAFDFAASAAKTKKAVEAIQKRQTSITADRVAQSEAVKTVYDEVISAGNAFYRKNATGTVKTAALAAYPVFKSSKSSLDAAYSVLTDAGLSIATIKNLLAIAGNAYLRNAVSEGVDGAKLPLSAAYKLGTAKATDEDIHAATTANVTPGNVQSWITQRAEARKLPSAWTAYRGAGNDAERGVTWRVIHAAYTAANAAPWPGMVKSLDADLDALISAEITTRHSAAQRDADNATNTAAQRASAASAAESALEEARQRVDALKAEHGARVQDANKARAEFDAKTDAEKRKATAALNAVNAEARKALTELETAQAALRSAQRDAKEALRAATDAKDSAEAKRKTAAESLPTDTRPTADTYDGLVAVYRSLPTDRLHAEAREIAAALAGMGGTAYADWLAHGAAINARLIEA